MNAKTGYTGLTAADFVCAGILFAIFCSSQVLIYFS